MKDRDELSCGCPRRKSQLLLDDLRQSQLPLIYELWLSYIYHLLADGRRQKNPEHQLGHFNARTLSLSSLPKERNR